MTRQQLRKSLRDAVKDLAKAKKTKEYKEMVNYFNTLPNEEYKMLFEGTHPDPKAQRDYLRFTTDMKDFIAIESRKEYYEGLLPKKEQN